MPELLNLTADQLSGFPRGYCQDYVNGKSYFCRLLPGELVAPEWAGHTAWMKEEEREVVCFASGKA